jgi:hypothetical protein
MGSNVALASPSQPGVRRQPGKAKPRVERVSIFRLIWFAILKTNNSVAVYNVASLKPF